jgi:hypothetical protein
MKIGCTCGSTISDQTDFLSYKAHFIADQDWYDVVDAAEGSELAVTYRNDQPSGTSSMARHRLWRWSREMWQCKACGRLYVEDHDYAIQGFTPDEASPPHNLLRSIHGDRWKRPLVGGWRTWIKDGPKGELWWGFGDAEEGFEQFEQWEQLEERYHEVFRRLLDKDILRSALLRYGDRTVHEWPHP